MRVDPGLVKLGLVGFGAYTMYGLALRGSFGTLGQNWAYQLRSAWGGTPTRLISGPGGATTQPVQQTPSTSTQTQQVSNTGQRYVSLSLHDIGGVPLVYDTQTQRVMQNPSWVATNAPGANPNVYGSGDVFLDSAGNTVSYDQAVAEATTRSA